MSIEVLNVEVHNDHHAFFGTCHNQSAISCYNARKHHITKQPYCANRQMIVTVTMTMTESTTAIEVVLALVCRGAHAGRAPTVAAEFGLWQAHPPGPAGQGPPGGSSSEPRSAGPGQ